MNIKQVLDNYDLIGEKLDSAIRNKLEKLPPKTLVTPSLLTKLQIPTSIAAQIMSSQWWHIRGIGPSLGAKLWIDGMRDPNDKKWFSQLPVQAQAWIIHKPSGRIPYDDVKIIANNFMQDEKHWEIVGSYRRGKPFMGDIDILYWGPDLDKLLDRLEKKHGPKWTIYARGPQKIGGMYHFDTKCVEVDIWIATQDNLPYMRLYATGSKQWNIIMRQIAKRKGMKLNQYCLERDGLCLPAKSEEDIFTHLGITYRPPEQRF
jgi:DNA polymerase/3'-5' exonuclease PolX